MHLVQELDDKFVVNEEVAAHVERIRANIAVIGITGRCVRLCSGPRQLVPKRKPDQTVAQRERERERKRVQERRESQRRESQATAIRLLGFVAGTARASHFW